MPVGSIPLGPAVAASITGTGYTIGDTGVILQPGSSNSATYVVTGTVPPAVPGPCCAPHLFTITFGGGGYNFTGATLLSTSATSGSGSGFLYPFSGVVTGGGGGGAMNAFH